MEIAEFVLRNEGTDVTKAWNGQNVVELFRKGESGEFVVILMDIIIWSLDREDAKKIPIIAMTANAFEEDKKMALASGMNDHVAKPIDMNVLLPTIMKYM